MPKTVRGVAPGFILIPAREYEWELVNKIQLTVPRSGKISELLNERELANGVKLPGDDEFCIWDGGDGILLLWEVVRVMFAKSNYPSLKDDECVNIVALDLEDSEQITVYGEILRYV